MLDLKEAMDELHEDQGWPLTMGDGEYHIEVSLSNDRTQVVTVELREDDEGNDLVFITSNACEYKKIKSGVMRKGHLGLMEDSADHAYVSYAARDGMIIVKASRMLEYLQKEELWKVVIAAAEEADALEEEKYGDKDDE